MSASADKKGVLWHPLVVAILTIVFVVLFALLIHVAARLLYVGFPDTFAAEGVNATFANYGDGILDSDLMAASHVYVGFPAVLLLVLSPWIRDTIHSRRADKRTALGA